MRKTIFITFLLKLSVLLLLMQVEVRGQLVNADSVQLWGPGIELRSHAYEISAFRTESSHQPSLNHKEQNGFESGSHGVPQANSQVSQSQHAKS